MGTEGRMRDPGPKKLVDRAKEIGPTDDRLRPCTEDASDPARPDTRTVAAVQSPPDLLPLSGAGHKATNSTHSIGRAKAGRPSIKPMSRSASPGFQAQCGGGRVLRIGMRPSSTSIGAQPGAL